MDKQRQEAINQAFMNAMLQAGIREAVIVVSPNEDHSAVNVLHIAMDYRTLYFTTLREQLIKDMADSQKLQNAIRRGNGFKKG